MAEGVEPVKERKHVAITDKNKGGPESSACEAQAQVTFSQVSPKGQAQREAAFFVNACTCANTLFPFYSIHIKLCATCLDARRSVTAQQS